MNVTTVTQLFLHYRYPVLIGLSFIEGPYIMMMSGLLIKIGTLALIPTYIALSVGDLLGDVAWYCVGYFLGEKLVLRWFGTTFGLSETNIEKAKHILLTHKRKILLGSKVTAGFGLSLAVLTGSGIVAIPFVEFILLNFLGQFWWTAIMLAIGYFFGNLYITINAVAGKIGILVIALLVLFLLLRLLKSVGSRVLKNSNSSSNN